MSNIEYIQEISKFHDYLNAVISKRPNELEYKINSILSSYQDMFERFCPFKVDEEVVISKPIDFSKAPGWTHSQHFLVVGAVAVVKTRDYRNGLFVFGVEFLEDSWIGLDGKVNKYDPDKRYLYSLSETFLSKHKVDTHDI